MNRTRSSILLVMAFSLFGWLRSFAAEASAPLELGAALPAVTATTHDGATVDLAAIGGKGFVLVYFYPKADTGGCTAQACSLRDAYATLTDKGVKVYGVSTDNVADQKAFHDKYSLNFPLLADPDKKVVKAFGVPTNLGGFASRQAFLFKDGKLVWRDLKAKTKEQADDVLAAIAKL